MFPLSPPYREGSVLSSRAASSLARLREDGGARLTIVATDAGPTTGVGSRDAHN